MIIDCGQLLKPQRGGVFRCVNCGAYFVSDEDASVVIENPAKNLIPAWDIDFPSWEKILALPPDLLRIIVEEYRCGNRISHLFSCGEDVTVCLTRPFHDSYMTSSWIEFLPRTATIPSRYRCDTMQMTLVEARFA